MDLLRAEPNGLVNPEWGERYEVRREMPDSGVTGYLVRKNWRGKAFSDRQRELDDFLGERFGDQAGDISLILTFSPEEYEAWADGQLAAS